MNPAPLFPLILVALSWSSGSQEGRPGEPYSRPPQSGLTRPGFERLALVPPGAPASVEHPETALDDGVPLPVPPVGRATPGGDVVDQPASGDPYFLGFAAGNHHPPAAERVDPQLYASALPAYPDGRPTPDTYAFVMFSKRMTPGRLAQLEALGCRLLGFHPHYTQKVALPAAAVDQVAALDFVRWLGVPQPWQKVHPALARALDAVPANQALEVWVSVYESDLGPASVQRTTAGTTVVDPRGGEGSGTERPLPHVYVSNGWQQRELELAGLEVLDFNDRARVFRARMMPQGLDLVTALDFVQFVELDVAMRPFHDETMPMVNADDVRNFYSGGDTAVAGIVDSGVETSHQDINVWGVGGNISSGTGSAFDDPCGHGTHVSGTILGQGVIEDGHRGAAPELGTSASRPYFSLRVFDTCDPENVDESAVVSWMASSSPKPHVINNSWGADPFFGSPWIGSETEARLFDYAAYDDAQLHVFAAGNAGPAASSIGLPGCAKNVLTVGNVIDYEEPTVGFPGELWTGLFGSAQGPCGDGRWKPNVVAPGRWVTSADASNLSGYKELYGTSMAAPHATGLLADVIDAHPAYGYLPEALSSLLMATALRKDGEYYAYPTHPDLDRYGAGLLDGTSAIWDHPGGGHSVWTFSLAPGSSTSGDFTVPSGATRLVAVMHYVEPGASAGASQALVNDWDLWLDMPPLTAGNNTGDFFIQQSAVDNTEIRVLQSPTSGTWRWKVFPTSTSSLAFFGVTIYVETADPFPFLTIGVSTSKLLLKGGEPVTFNLTALSQGAPASVFVETAGLGAPLAASTYLLDGPTTSLLDNEHGGQKLELGTVHPFFSRHASWLQSWPTSGVRNLTFTGRSDSAVNSPASLQTAVSVDADAPLPPGSISSPSHNGQWSNDPTVDIVWTASVDPVVNGVASGLDGYGHSITTGSAGTPTQVKTLGTVTGFTTPPLASGKYWFNLRPVDLVGNWGSAASLSGIKIDTIQPGVVSNLASTSHTLNVLSCDATVSMTWDPAADNGGSGVAGYAVSFDQNPTGGAPLLLNVTGTSTSKTLPSSALGWYVHVRAIDGAGNPGNTVTAGPYYVDTDPTQTYCTAKVNSQGCTPQIGSTGAPSFASSTLTVTASQVLNNKVGLMFWGTAASANPFQGGTKCVANPVRRTPTQSAGGNPPPDDCSGTYAFDLTSGYMTAQGIGVGDTIFCQWWSRDPADPFTTGLTNALQVTVCP